MLYGFMPIERQGETHLRLCITPDKTDALSVPILIDEMIATNSAVIRVGNEEALVVSLEGESTLLLNAIEPAAIFLTPNVAAFPGLKTKYVKVQRFSDGTYRTFYSRDKTKWEEWVPNRERT